MTFNVFLSLFFYPYLSLFRLLIDSWFIDSFNFVVEETNKNIIAAN